MSRGPKQTDFTTRKQTIGIAFLLFVILAVWEIVGQVFSLWLLLPNLIVALGIGWVVQRLTLGAAVALVDTVHGVGHIPAPPSYSLQESMIVRGRYEDAADSFRNHIAEHPEDLDARLALAHLLEAYLRDYRSAEQLYLEVRRSNPNPHQEMGAANGLIDLCRKAGKTERLRVELSRFADRYRGSPAADAALGELRQLEAADLTSESPRFPR